MTSRRVGSIGSKHASAGKAQDPARPPALSRRLRPAARWFASALMETGARAAAALEACSPGFVLDEGPRRCPSPRAHDMHRTSQAERLRDPASGWRRPIIPATCALAGQVQSRSNPTASCAHHALPPGNMAHFRPRNDSPMPICPNWNASSHGSGSGCVVSKHTRVSIQASSIAVQFLHRRPVRARSFPQGPLYATRSRVKKRRRYPLDERSELTLVARFCLQQREAEISRFRARIRRLKTLPRPRNGVTTRSPQNGRRSRIRQVVRAMKGRREKRIASFLEAATSHPRDDKGFSRSRADEMGEIASQRRTCIASPERDVGDEWGRRFVPECDREKMRRSWNIAMSAPTKSSPISPRVTLPPFANSTRGAARRTLDHRACQPLRVFPEAALRLSGLRALNSCHADHTIACLAHRFEQCLPTCWK